MQIRQPPEAWLFVGAIAVFVAANVGPQNLPTYTHLMSWAIIWGGTETFARMSPTADPSSFSFAHINELAFAIANVLVSCSLGDVQWLTPLVPFLVSFSAHRLGLPTADTPIIASEKFQGFNKQPWVILAIAACSSLVMLPNDVDLAMVGIAVWSVLSQTTVFVLLEINTNNQNEQTGSQSTLLRRVSGRVVLLLVVFAIATSSTSLPVVEVLQPIRTLPTAALNASYWFLLIQMTSNMKFEFSSVSYTYSVLCARTFQRTDLLKAAAPASISLIVLAQMRLLSTRLLRHWSVFLALALLPLTALFTSTSLSYTTRKDYTPRAGYIDAEHWGASLHPMENLHLAAKERFDETVKRQSTTLAQAVTEYTRRYKRDPPPHFDQWYAIASENNILLIDEFDTLMSSLEAFWGVPPQDLRDRVAYSFQKGPALCQVAIKNGTLDDPCWFGGTIQEMLNPGLHLLPDMVIAFNSLDEPRVLVPHEVLQSFKPHAHMRFIKPSILEKIQTKPRFINVMAQDSWELLTASCAVDSPGRKEQISSSPQSRLLFVNNVTEANDFCLQPEMSQQHGMAVSPASLQLTNTVLPIFSQGSLTTFNDILYPAPYYLAERNDGDYDHDMPYHEKNNKLYWAGATTGGNVDTFNWNKLHRHRFVSVANAPNDSSVLLLEQDLSQESSWHTQTSPFSAVASLFDVKFTNAVQCASADCEHTAAEHFHFGPGEDRTAPFSSKLVMDIDGNGFSGRYHRLLRSNSCVLKQAAFREWHDDWLVPWLHYVPISMGMVELPEAVRFLTTDDRGYAVGAAIASKGKDFTDRALRTEDFGLSLVRILMEYGRLMNDDRDNLRCEKC